MAELVVDFITSLDGYGAAEGWPGWWGMEGPQYLAWLEQQPEGSYTALMGANTYRLMSDFSDQAARTTEPTEESESLVGLAALDKIVFSATLTEPLTWPNSALISTDAVEAVRTMKETGAPSMRTIGSVSLSRSLLRAGIVDRFRVVVFPVITGASGTDRIYDGYPDVALDMIASRTFDNSIQLLEYKPRVLDNPPDTATS